MSQLNVDTIGGQTGNTIAIASGNTLTGIVEGVKEIDTWIIKADITADSIPIVDSQVQRMSDTLVEKVGTGMAVDSNGHWTFPSTGYYELKFIGSLENDTNSNATDIHIDATDDNFSTESRIFYGRYYGNDNSRVTMVANLVVKISDVANDKVKFDFNEVNTSTIHGDTAEFESGFIFTKLREL